MISVAAAISVAMRISSSLSRTRIPPPSSGLPSRRHRADFATRAVFYSNDDVGCLIGSILPGAAERLKQFLADARLHFHSDRLERLDPLRLFISRQRVEGRLARLLHRVQRIVVFLLRDVVGEGSRL